MFEELQRTYREKQEEDIKNKVYPFLLEEN